MNYSLESNSLRNLLITCNHDNQRSGKNVHLSHSSVNPKQEIAFSFSLSLRLPAQCMSEVYLLPSMASVVN